MAIQTRVMGSCRDETNGTTAVLSIDYDDALLRITGVHLVNPTTFAVFATAIRANGTGQTYTLNAAPGQTIDVAVPGGAQARLDVTIDARGRVDGVEYHFGFGTA